LIQQGRKASPKHAGKERGGFYREELPLGERKRVNFVSYD